MTKLRKQLGHYGKIQGITINTEKLIDELQCHGLFDTAWTSASAYADQDENLFIKTNVSAKMNFNGDNDKNYTEVNLSTPTYSSNVISDQDAIRESHMIYRLKRLDKNRVEYSEHADETTHSIDDKFIVGELAKLFSFFKGKVCRVRIANLKAGNKINPHVDYDPSYIFRYHVPLITNDQCLFFVVVDDQYKYYKMPSDGDVYWINTGIKHGVINNSNEDRLHLLIDVTGDKEQENIPNIDFLMA